ncbi:MAG: hotdog fold thioesterase [Bacteroidota bacterium]
MNWNTTDLVKINALCENTLMRYLKIEFVSIDALSLSATMPVNATTHQPMGLLHGGANAVLIESIASMGSALLCDLKNEAPVGLEINANHLGSVKSGSVKGVGKAIHIGKTTHVWQVEIFDETTNKLICIGRLTVLIKKIS